MKYVKMLGLVAVAAAALMAFAGAGTASATVLCKQAPIGGKCSAGQGYSGEIHAASETEKPTLTGGIITITCDESTVTGNATEGTSTGTETPNGAVSTLTFGPAASCTCPVTVVKKGTLEIHWLPGGSNGTLTSSGAEVTVNCSTIFGTVHCIYVTENTDLGTLTSSAVTGGEATMDITATIPRKTTNALCDEEAVWHAKYKVTTPIVLYVAQST